MCLVKLLSIEDINKMISEPLFELRHFCTIQSFIKSKDFPFQLSWDLKTRNLHFYISKDEALARKEPLHMALTNHTFLDQLKEQGIFSSGSQSDVAKTKEKLLR